MGLGLGTGLGSGLGIVSGIGFEAGRPQSRRDAAIKLTWWQLLGLPATDLHRMCTELLCTQP